MLFDVARDPGETRNAARENPTTVAELLSELTAWREVRPWLDLRTSTNLDLDDATKERLEALGYGH